MNENERFRLVFAKTGSIHSGTDIMNNRNKIYTCFLVVPSYLPTIPYTFDTKNIVISTSSTLHNKSLAWYNCFHMHMYTV